MQRSIKSFQIDNLEYFVKFYEFKRNILQEVEPMDLSFSYFFEQMMANPLLLMAVALTLGVILVNGWTDAPNAIATCVVTRCLSPRLAILMAAVFNFL